MVKKIITWFVSLLKRYGYKLLTIEEYTDIRAKLAERPAAEEEKKAQPNNSDYNIRELIDEWLNGEKKDE